MESELKRTITRTDLVLLVVGGVIGAGIFLVPGGVLTRTGGTVGVSLLVWLVGGVLTLLGALTYGELAAMIPGTGGLYLYIRDAFGAFPAFLYGWTLFVAISAGAVATLSVAITGYVQQFVTLGSTQAHVLAILVVAGLAWMSVRGTKLSVRFLDVATALKVGALVLLIVTLPLAGRGLAGPVVWWPARWDAGVLQGAGLAMIAVLFAYEGWQFITFVAGEVVAPQRNFPWGLILGTLALIVIYVLANLAYLTALGPAGVMASNRVASEAVTMVFGPRLGGLIAIPIIISMVSAAHIVILTSSRVYFAMARDRVFFARLAVVHPRYGTPAFAVLAASLVAGGLTLLGTFQQLFSYVVFVGWIFYGLGGVAVLVLRRTRPDAVRPFRVPGYPVTPLLFTGAALAIIGNAIVSQPPRETLFALAMVGLGVPAYWVWRRGRGRL